MVSGRKQDVARKTRARFVVLGLVVCALLGAVLMYVIAYGFDMPGQAVGFMREVPIKPPRPVLNRGEYDRRMELLANYPSTVSTSSPQASSTQATPVRLWPVKDAPYPLAGAILPFKRVIAYYGNFYSRGMGVLGQYDAPEMLTKLRAAVAEWEAADPSTPVVPAIHYIVTTAQELPQKDGMYTLRMPDSQIDKALELAKEVDGIVFIDFQVGLSTLQKELPHYVKYLAMPNVHLGVDPEFSMKTGAKPGRVIGSYDAADINFAAEYLAKLVRDNDLPPKILVVHRFTQDMVTNYQNIQPLPEVQIVMDMDGWGEEAKKINTYTRVIVPEPVQFTGFKIFYKNDLLPPSTGLMTPEDLLKMKPRPIYIQYQ